MRKVIDTAIGADPAPVGLGVRYALGCFLGLFGAAIALAIKLIA
jgi:hypothetical protein